MSSFLTIGFCLLLSRPVHRFRIAADDGGFPVPYTDYTDVTIYLEDINDTPPRFPSSMIATLTEELPNVSTPVYNVTATDPDLGKGGLFKYYLRPGSWPTGLFTINSDSGVCFVL